MKRQRLSVNYPLLVGAIAAPLLVAVVGFAFTVPEIATWYAQLVKPSFSPPNWLFGPVWTVLYILQGVAFYLVVSKSKKGVQRPVVLFFAQLLVNLCWSIFFFGLHQPLLALFDIVLLWLLIIATTLEFRKKSQTAAWLMVPYIGWVTFATILNAAIVSLNS